MAVLFAGTLVVAGPVRPSGWGTGAGGTAELATGPGTGTPTLAARPDLAAAAPAPASVPAVPTSPAAVAAVGVPAPVPATTPAATPATTPTTFVRRSPPPGVGTHGYGDQGWSQSASSGTTTVRLEVYPADIYLDQHLSVTGRASGTGAVKSVRVDYGDGQVHDVSWVGPGCWSPARDYDLAVVGGPRHLYAAPGTYTVTATVTTVDCVPPPGFPLVHEVIPFMPDGSPTPRGEYAPMGAETTLTVSLTVLVRPETIPPPVGPPPGP